MFGEKIKVIKQEYWIMCKAHTNTHIIHKKCNRTFMCPEIINYLVTVILFGFESK